LSAAASGLYNFGCISHTFKVHPVRERVGAENDASVVRANPAAATVTVALEFPQTTVGGKSGGTKIHVGPAARRNENGTPAVIMRS
jgi:hypothetical protein